MSGKKESIVSQIRKRERAAKKSAKRAERQARRRGESLQIDPWVNRRGA